jgi:hypothetical protein
MEGLFTNSSARRDFTLNAFERFGRNCDVLLASAFFTDPETVLGLLDRRCRVQLVVRLGAATSPDALRKVYKKEGIQVRYFTDSAFHPKLFIFGAACALVGSANVTGAGLRTNQEITVSLPSSDPRFDELLRLFASYWEQAHVMDDGPLALFTEVRRRHQKDTEANTDAAVIEALGRIVFDNLPRGLPRPGRRDVFVDSYRRRYQSFRDAYEVVDRVYRGIGRRMVTVEFPVRIEIDQFFNFIREKHAIGESYHSAPLLTGPALESRIADLVEEFLAHDWDYLTKKVVPVSYPRITRTLGSQKAIDAASEDEVYDALLCVHAFHDRFRFYEGGHPTMRRSFLGDNGLPRIKATLIHLLHGGPSDHVVRMAECIFDETHQLQHFGESCVQETFGWVNSEHVPICNGRTLKSLRWLGFNVNAP